jgi:hypothetical protein
MPRPLHILCATLLPITLLAAEPAGRLIILRHTEGGTVTDYHYTSLAGTTRLDRHGAATIPPSPWNLIDHATAEITVLRPHNQSISKIAATEFATKPPRSPADALASLPDTAGLPPDVAAAIQSARDRITQINGSSPTTPSTATGNIGPDPALLPQGPNRPPVTAPVIPALPEIPKIPALPAPPVTPGAPAPPAMPPPPAPPMIPQGGIPGAVPPMMPPGGVMPGQADPAVGQLIAQKETRTIHGLACVRHVLRLDRSQELELWLTASPELPPFYLLTWDGPPRFGPRHSLQEWPHRIREAGKFPMLAILREVATSHPPLPDGAIPPPPKEQARWEVLEIKTATSSPDFFKMPENFLHNYRPKS